MRHTFNRSEVIQYVQSGWPDKIKKKELQPYFIHRYEITVSNSCLLWRLRLVIPEVLHQKVLSAPLETDTGIVRMKSIACSYVWWPGIDAAVEEVAKRCISCAQRQTMPSKVMVHPWAFPKQPWQHLHLDFVGPVYNRI